MTTVTVNIFHKLTQSKYRFLVKSYLPTPTHTQYHVVPNTYSYPQPTCTKREIYRFYIDVLTTMHLRKVPTFKLSILCQIFTNFQNFLHCWKAYKIRISYPSHLKHDSTLPWEIKHSNFLEIFSSSWFSLESRGQATDPWEIRLSTSLLCTPLNTNFSSKSCPRCWIPCWHGLVLQIISYATYDWYKHLWIIIIIIIIIQKFITRS